MHTITLKTDEEYAEILAALSRIKESPHPDGFEMYCRIWEDTPLRIQLKSNDYRMALEFSKKPRLG